MEKCLEKLIDSIWHLALNRGREHPESYVSEDTIIEEDILYNCSYYEFICNLGNVIHGIGDIRICVLGDEDTVSIKVYKGREWNSPKDLVFCYLRREDMATELKYESGDWEQIVLDCAHDINNN
jgi:hypothetical protein